MLLITKNKKCQWLSNRPYYLQHQQEEKYCPDSVATYHWLPAHSPHHGRCLKKRGNTFYANCTLLIVLVFNNFSQSCLNLCAFIKSVVYLAIFHNSKKPIYNFV